MVPAPNRSLREQPAQDKRKAGQDRPGSFALFLFKASAPRLHQSNMRFQIKSKTLGGYPAGPR
jgi:hypothetical protein